MQATFLFGQVCRDFLRGRCQRDDCRFAHPSDHVAVDTSNLVIVCIDFLNGRCSRTSCRYFHPPAHLAKSKSAAAGEVSVNVLFHFTDCSFGPCCVVFSSCRSKCMSVWQLIFQSDSSAANAQYPYEHVTYLMLLIVHLVLSKDTHVIGCGLTDLFFSTQYFSFVWVPQRVSEWVSECVSEWVSACVSEWVSEWVEWVSESFLNGTSAHKRPFGAMQML